MLELKVHSPIMLLRNINPAEGLCNGTRLMVVKLLPNMIHAAVLTGAYAGKRVMIPKVRMSDTRNPHYTLVRLQFPVRLNFAMTINKSQGQSFTHVAIFLRRPVFDHGQMYVAVSRVRDKAKLFIQIVETESQGKVVRGSESHFTPNVVFREVFD